MKKQVKIVNLLTPGDLVRVRYTQNDKAPKTGFYLGEKSLQDLYARPPGLVNYTVAVVILEDGTLIEVENKFVQRISSAAKI